MSAEGKVAQRAEIQPIASKAYLELKKLFNLIFQVTVTYSHTYCRKQIEDAGRPKYQVQQLKEMPRSTYKPVSDHKANVSIF